MLFKCIKLYNANPDYRLTVGKIYEGQIVKVASSTSAVVFNDRGQWAHHPLEFFAPVDISVDDTKEKRTDD